MNNQPILSICIPTRNRADVLDQCLKSIVRSEAFSNLVEVVISDNCSSDGTELLVADYINKYPNIKYYRNDSNLGGDRNILLSLERGSGVFLKIHNDYSVFLDDGLAFLLQVVKENIEKKPAMYFRNEDISYPKKEMSTFEELFRQEKWAMSWIGCYGYWRDDFQNFEERDRRIDTRFQQVDWFIRSYKDKKNIRYVCKKISDRYPFKGKQGGYNFIEVHTRNFMIQFEELADQGVITQDSIEYVKKESLMPGIISWYVRLLIANKGRYSYEKRGGFSIIRREFGQYNWFWMVFFKCLIRTTYKTIKSEYIKPAVKKLLGWSK